MTIPPLKIAAASTGKSVTSVPFAVPIFILSLSTLTFFQVENDSMIRELSGRVAAGYGAEERQLLKTPLSVNTEKGETEVFILTDTNPAPIRTAYNQ